MQLQLRHRTTYHYSEPVTFGRHRLVLRPREGHDLRILDARLDIQPLPAITWIRDVYGNSIALADFSEAATRLDIVSDVTLERSHPFPAKRFHEPFLIPWPVPYAVEEQALVDAYRRPSFPDDVSELQRWLDRASGQRPGDAEGMLLDLCRHLHQHVEYRRRAEKGVQTPAQTVFSGRGSCRDMATLMMDAARVLGVASRFASGYLHGPVSVAGRASTHAWTECYLPALGWRGFDPTIGRAVGLEHVATGVSQHPRGVMPVSGSFVGARSAFQAMEVEVRSRVIASPRSASRPAGSA